MLWLALHLPLLSLEAFCASLDPDARARPVALVADHRIHSANRAATELGVRPGIKRATAMALAADLLLAESHDGRDAAALLAVGHAALAFSPAVALHDGRTVLLEVQACLRLFGGLAALRSKLAAAVAPLGHRLQMAAAPTALGAAIVAQWHPVQRMPAEDLVLGLHATQLPVLQHLLDNAPVWMLGPGQMHWEALQGMGLQRLSDLRHLPRSGLARRFGADLLDDLDRAYGQRPDPRSWLTLPAVFSSRLELFARADSTAQVLYGADVLLARLVAWAQARHARIAAFTLQMQHERCRQGSVPPTTLRIELAEPALALSHLQLLLRERLGRCELAAPTLELQLLCRDIVASPAPNGELFPTHASETEGLVRLLERLRARLGDTQVQHIVPVADHRPERASQAVPAQGAAPALPTAAQDQLAAWQTPGLLPATLHRPAWLLAEPSPLAERNALPLLHGKPLQLLSGPERIEAGWWDGDPVARDYFIAQAADDALVWVFCDRVPGEHGEVHWYLQGLFA